MGQEVRKLVCEIDKGGENKREDFSCGADGVGADMVHGFNFVEEKTIEKIILWEVE